MIESEESSVTPVLLKTYEEVAKNGGSPDVIMTNEEGYVHLLGLIGLTKEEFEKRIDVYHENGIVYIAKKWRINNGIQP